MTDTKIRNCALYCRVSTSRQAEKDLSIPDQLRHARQYCEQRDWELVREFVEPGASATNDNRRVFQELIAFACGPDKPIDAVLVHSFSRFFRDDYDLETYRRRLQKHGVSLISMTQEIADSPQGDLIRSFITKCDAYHSAETAKHTTRTMLENARQGYWNGGKPPFGYRTVEAEKRGDRVKKRLAIDEDEATLVRRIYDLYTNGDGVSGPLGVKAIVNHLNDRGINRRGKMFYVSHVHDILQRTIYTGTHYFNRLDSKTREIKPREEWIPVDVPPIIEQVVFDKVQRTLEAKRPQNTPPRVVSGPTLLSGLLKCATCGGSMVLRTGKSGQYRYYACSTCARKGKTACPGRSIRMDFMDDLILQELAQKLFTPERLYLTLQEIMDRSKCGKEALKQKLARLKKEHSAKAAALSNLYAAIEEGLIDLNDPQLKERITKTKAYRDELEEQVELLSRQISDDDLAITPEKLEAFAKLMREKFFGGNPGMQKAYLNLFIEQIMLNDNEVRITGSKHALTHAICTPEKLNTSKVPSFVREWYAD
ncbi:recombinase family protein [uncultured Cohaesibacter sp.]|uniref:recombinase family protein n=1 Tax=uncultured Cohaesibacter sp. TaxID=1002546 RepID=UPI0029C70FD8|nr:recombinase family protein [uncultured Cohaesibacter sp.]